ARRGETAGGQQSGPVGLDHLGRAQQFLAGAQPLLLEGREDGGDAGSGQHARADGGGGEDIAVADQQGGGRPFEGVAVGGDEQDVLGAAAHRLPGGGHVHG